MHHYFSKVGKACVEVNNGDYGKINGEWIVKTPNGLVASIRNHQVVEHEDRTITALPSILISGTNYPDTTEVLTWHGFLERGVWRDV